MSRDLIFGVGINDANYSARTVISVGGKQKTIWECPYYKTWKSMLRRCYSDRWLGIHPSYIGSSFCNEWHTLSIFSEWMFSKEFNGMHLDKDILIPGNKIYSPDRCVFISQPLNKFITESKKSRGQWPVGVHFDGNKGRFIAQVNNPFTGKRQHLGGFDCPDAAHEAWRIAKHRFACRYAEIQPDYRVAEALRTRYLKEVAK